MSVIDQPALDLPGLAAPPPDVLAGLTVQDRAAVLDRGDQLGRRRAGWRNVASTTGVK